MLISITRRAGGWNKHFPIELGLAWIVILAFIRVTTRAGIMAKPLHYTHALAYVDGWLNQPHVELKVRENVTGLSSGTC